MEEIEIENFIFLMYNYLQGRNDEKGI